MNLSKIGIDFLDDVEGRMKLEYSDSFGYPTIGIGHLLTRSELMSGKIKINEEYVKYLNGLADAQMDALLLQDMDPVEDVINRRVSARLTQYQFDALCSFIHNVGVGAFEGSTLLRLLNLGHIGQVPYQMRRWNRGGATGHPKKVIQGLVNRRELDVILWLNRWRVVY